MIAFIRETNEADNQRDAFHNNILLLQQEINYCNYHVVVIFYISLPLMFSRCVENFSNVLATTFICDANETEIKLV